MGESRWVTATPPIWTFETGGKGLNPSGGFASLTGYTLRRLRCAKERAWMSNGLPDSRHP